MTPEQFAEITARAEAAWPGPWWVEAETPTREMFIAYGIQGDLSETFDLSEKYDEADYVFMASARADVPALIEEVERLQAIELAALAYLSCPPSGPEVVVKFYELCRVCGVDPNRALGV